ncbi:hypothetical protein B9Z55_017738 [Caenorhabditis nigoni]|uniref:Uncharacterized protein n=1 Tax=Caenorhabditis nigoni TaxID=1611254 RepID=A0A2G5TAG1_9PELO|nr:hypothetical protein B9Z55_017738 [Caenorhabditis nigoni]
MVLQERFNAEYQIPKTHSTPKQNPKKKKLHHHDSENVRTYNKYPITSKRSFITCDYSAKFSIFRFLCLRPSNKFNEVTTAHEAVRSIEHQISYLQKYNNSQQLYQSHNIQEKPKNANTPSAIDTTTRVNQEKGHFNTRAKREN